MCFIAFYNGPMICKGYKKANIGRLDNQIIMSLVPCGSPTFYIAIEATEVSNVKMYYPVIF